MKFGDLILGGALVVAAAAALPVLAQSSNTAATGNPAVTAGGTAVSGAPMEDVQLTAAKGDIADEDGLPTSFTAQWQWSRALPQEDGSAPPLPAYLPVSSASSTAAATSTYTPEQSDVGHHLRVCAQFDDSDGNTEERCWASAMPVANVNDAAFGSPRLLDSANPVDSLTVSEDDILIMVTGPVTDDDGGVDSAVFLWQWWLGASAEDLANFLAGTANTVAPIAGADTNTFVPGDEQVGGFLMVCASFRDAFGTLERLCSPINNAVANVNDVPTGTPYLAVGTAANNSLTTTAVQGLTYFLGVVSAGSTVMDGDGITGGSNNVDGSLAGGGARNGMSWQLSDSPDGPWQERKFGQNKSNDNTSYTTDAADAGRWLRGCNFYTDDNGTLEGGISDVSRATAAFKSQRERLATICSVPVLVANVNDAPVADSPSIAAPAGGSHTFTLDDFVYTDADGDSLTHVYTGVFGGLQTDEGTVQLNSADALMTWVPVADINAGNLVWTPPSSATASSTPFTSLTYRVRDDGDDGEDPTANRESAEGTLTLHIRRADPAPATGMVTITSTTVAEDSPITAADSTTDPNGTNYQSMRFAWSQGEGEETTSGGMTTTVAPSLTDNSAWTHIITTRSTSPSTGTGTFTPGDAQVGDYIRVCMTYDDWLGNTNGPLCAATATAVTGVNDAPYSADFSLDVATMWTNPTNPFRFPADAFPFEDDDGDDWASVTIFASASGASSLYDADGIRTLHPDSAVIPRNRLRGAGYSLASSRVGLIGNIQGYDHLQFYMTDSAGVNTATHTITINTTELPQMPPVGRPIIRPPVSQPTNALFTEGVRMSVTPRRNNRPETMDATYDPNGVQNVTVRGWWEISDTGTDGTWSREGTVDLDFTPRQEHVGKFLRYCITFVDLHSMPEQSGPICSDVGGPVINVDNPPSVPPSGNTTAFITSEHDADDPFVFRLSHFAFADADGDELTHVIIHALTNASGTLLHDGTAVTTNDLEVPVAAIQSGLLTYYPVAGSVASTDHNTLQYRVRVDDEARTASATSGSGLGEVRMELMRSATQVAATATIRITERDLGVAVGSTTAEDLELDGGSSTFTDGNHVAPNSTMLIWQVADPVTSGGTSAAPAEGSEDWETATTAPRFTPLQAHVGKYLRLCISFTDGLGNAEGPFCSTATLVTDVNDPATGAAIFTSDSGTPTEYPQGAGLVVSPRDGYLADEDGLPPFDGGDWAYSIQVSTGPDRWVEREYKQAAHALVFGTAYPPQERDVGLYIRACVFFEDMAGNAEGGDDTTALNRGDTATLCNEPGKVVINRNDAPTGTLGAAAATSAPAEGTALSLDVTRLMDPDGVTAARFAWQWQQAAPVNSAAPDGGSDDWADIAGAAAATFTPDDAQVGQYIRACVSYTDDWETRETFCEAYSMAVTNVNDAPVAYDTTVFVPTSASDTSPYEFALGDFVFSDMDGDSTVTEITITSHSSAGALTVDGTLLTSSAGAPASVTVANVGRIQFNPDSSDAANSFATFTYTVTDGTDTSGAATVTIDLVGSGQQAARGAPSLTVQTGALYDEDVPITASTRGLLDANGIDAATFTWQWQVADAADGAYAPIAGADAATFTPLQAQVGRFVRVCARFTDGGNNAEGPLCSVPAAAITNVDDAPVAMDLAVDVTTNTDSVTAVAFGTRGFPSFADEDGDALDYVLLTTLPDAGTLVHGSTTLTRAHLPRRLDAGIDLFGLRWHPPEGLLPRRDYAMFNYKVSAGGRMSGNIGTVDISLIAPGPIAATGVPGLDNDPQSANFNAREDLPIVATTNGIIEPNGIDHDSLQWQWWRADAPPGGGTPDLADYRIIAGATSDRITPLQEDAGAWFRVCLTFMDNDGGSEGPLCATVGPVAERNDRPVSMSTSVDVFNTASAENPFRFAVSDFPFTDEESEHLTEVTLFTLPGLGTTQINGQNATENRQVPAADIPNITWWPPAGAEVAQDYTTFFFLVHDEEQADVGGSIMTINLVAPAPTPAVGSPSLTVASGLVFAEDNEITASTEGIRDPNGIDDDSVTWIWQAAAAPAEGSPEESAYSTIAGQVAATFTPLQAQVGRYIRACAFFMDEHSTPANEGGTAAAPTLCSVPGLVTNVNDAPSGAPAIRLQDGTDVVTGGLAEDSRYVVAALGGTLADEDGITDGPTLLDAPNGASWQHAATAAGPWTERKYAQTISPHYAPTQADVVGVVRVCLFYRDDLGGDNGGDNSSPTTRVTDPTACTAALEVANTNDLPSGALTITPANVAEDTELTAAPGTLADEDGITGATYTYKWRQALSADGEFADIAGATAATFTPGDDQVGRHLQACASYEDDAGADETLCTTLAGAVANVNDAPVAVNNDVEVFTTATASDPRPLVAADFPFTDVDGDLLASVTLVTLPASGTGSLLAGGTALTAVPASPITVEQLNSGHLAWHPVAGAAAANNYASFTFNVTDDGDDGTGDMTSTTAATLTINLGAPRQVAAEGAPAVSPISGIAYTEDVQLTASRGTVRDANGIDDDSVAWQWQTAAAQADGSAPGDDSAAWAAIAGADGAEFTPLQANVGQYLRACMTFDDQFETVNSEGPLCSAPAQVANVNDAPTSVSTEVNVFTTATAANPYRFKAGDFPYTDEDEGATLHSIFIFNTTFVTAGTLALDGTEVTGDITVAVADLGNLVFYPSAGAVATRSYGRFSFRVMDAGGLSSDARTMTINIVPPGPLAAEGMPAIAGAANATQNQELSAGRGTVRDPNGINADTIMWRWQQAAPGADDAVPADDSNAWADIPGAAGDADEAGALTLTQAQVGLHIRVCMTFMDTNIDVDSGQPDPRAEGPLCSAATAAVRNVNDAPVAESVSYQAARDGNSSEVTIPASAFAAAYNDIDDDDPLSAVTITRLPPEADGTLQFNGMALTVTAESGHTLMVEDGDFMGGDLTFTIAESAGSLQETSLDFTLRDSEGADSAEDATLTITFGKDIEEEQVQQVSAILSVAAVTNATNAIGGAISGAGANIPNAPAFDISMGGTSLMGTAQKLGQSKTADSPHHDWYLGTAPQWEHNAAYNASDNSAESLLNRINAMARGDIALNYSLTDTSNMRFWARYQSLDINGNEGESLEYDGSGTGFYLGADNQITDTMRIGLAIGTDSSDITLDLDEDGTDDEATRSATSFYPYLHIDLGNNNNARVIAGFGSGTLDIKSTANSNSTASADLSWNMLAASISHHRQMKGNLSARFDGSLQLGNTSTDETTFSSGSTLMAADSSTNELSINAELRYQKNNITPFASLAARKLGGDLSQSMALDMAFGADLQTNPANLRIAITRQINDTIHQRHSISLDASTNPNPSGLSASLGSNYDTITGRPQWRTTIGWQRKRFQTSLQASPGDYRLRARLRW